MAWNERRSNATGWNFDILDSRMLPFRNRKKNGEERLAIVPLTDCIPYVNSRWLHSVHSAAQSILRAYTLYASAEGALNRQITFTHADDSRLFSRVVRKFDITLEVVRVYKDLLKPKSPRDIEILRDKSFNGFVRKWKRTK